MRVSPFESNPFCTRFVRPGQIPYLFSGEQSDAAPIDNLVDLLADCRTGLIAGPHGTGKSTLLHSLRPCLDDRFNGTAQVQLCAPQTHSWLSRQKQTRINAQTIFELLSSVNAELVIIDGIEQLSALSRHRLIRQCDRNSQTILATSHSDLRGLKTLHRTKSSQQIVQQLTETLLADQSWQLQSRIQKELANRPIHSTTNVRELWFEMYDLCITQS